MNQTAVNKFSKDERFEGYLLVRNAEKRLNKNNEPYLDITLADNTGDINAKVWNCDDEPPASGTVLKVRGSVTEYNKRLQFKIERYRMAESQDEVDLSALVAAAPRLPRLAGLAPVRLLVAFVADAGMLSAMSAIEPHVVAPEQFHVGTHAAYLHCASGILESKAAEALLGKAGKAANTRNWATVQKLRALVEKIDG